MTDGNQQGSGVVLADLPVAAPPPIPEIPGMPVADPASAPPQPPPSPPSAQQNPTVAGGYISPGLSSIPAAPVVQTAQVQPPWSKTDVQPVAAQQPLTAPVEPGPQSAGMPPPPPPDYTPAPQPFSPGQGFAPQVAENVPQQSMQDTVIVPPSGESPYVPQGVGGSSAGVPPSGGGSLLKKVFILLFFLLLIGGVVLGGKFALGFFQSNQEVTIQYWGLWENDAFITPLITEFEASNPNVKVQYVKQNHRQYRERLQAAIARGDGPDVFRFHNTWVPMLKDDLAPVPETVMSASAFSSAFYRVASRDLVAGQTIFGIPLMIDGLGLYYNEDMLASAGVALPTTYEELLQVVPQLTVRQEDQILTSAIAMGTTGNVEHFSDIVAVMMMQNGAKLTEPQGVEAEQTLIFYRKFADPSDPVYTWNETLDNSIVAFANGQVAMMFAPSWRAFDIKQINPNLRFRIAPLPQLPGNTVTWASYWVEGVSAKSKQKEAAWDFLSFITSRESATKLYTEASKSRLFGEPYARVDMGEGLAEDPYVGAYIKQAPDARSCPLASRTFDNGINDKLIKYLEDAVNSVKNGSAPTEALETAATGFSQVLRSYGLTSGSASAQ